MNEKSLHGQFEDVETFLKSLKIISGVLISFIKRKKIGFIRQPIFMNVISRVTRKYETLSIRQIQMSYCAFRYN